MVTRMKTGSLPQSRVHVVSSWTTEPKNATEAIVDPLWFQAMQDEFEALKRNQTWTLVPASRTQHIVDHKWVFKKKLNVDGSLHKLKARLVAKGFQ